MGAREKLRRLAMGCAVAGATALVPASGAMAAKTITVEPAPASNTFAPKRVTTTLSAAEFTWVWGPNGAGTVAPHNVIDDTELFRSETVVQGQFLVSASAGSFHYFCSIHFGMDARIAVRPEAGEGYPGPFRVSWASAGSSTGNRFDVRYRVGDGKWKLWLENTRARSALFKRGVPGLEEESDAPRPISFRARSKKTRTSGSDWSPVLRVGG